jgi:CheY-like chemotaxis protein
LAAVLGILKGHRAGLHVRTSPGKGSSFRIYFPALGVKGTQEASLGVPAPDRRRKAVLFADDDEDLRSVVGEIIRNMMGLQLYEATDGREAVEVFKLHGDSIGLVLMDATMPHMKGPEAFEEIRKLRPDIAGILISGFAEETTREMASRSGFQQSMKKPFTLKELKECVDSALGR